MTENLQAMMAEAQASVTRVTAAEAQAMIAAGAVPIDVREAAELAGGMVPGAIHVPRGMLEFRADPASPLFNPALQPAGSYVLYCASGGRAMLAALTLQRMGFANVRVLGGFQDWVAGGGAVAAG